MGLCRCRRRSLIKIIMKVSITIDDANPAIVAAFGADSLVEIANDLGYMSQVEKTEDELPEKISVVINPGDVTENTVMQYPEGTEMFKANPQTPGQFVGEAILKTRIIPALVENMRKRKQEEVLTTVETEMTQAASAIEAAAEVTTI